MAQKEIEMILMRQLAAYLAMPIFIVDPQGNLVYYNEPAEAILGRRFEETGEMTASEWVTIFTARDEVGNQIAREELPLVIALRQKKPAQRSFWINGLDNVPRFIQVTAFPLLGEAGREMGAVAMFWDLKK